MTIIKVNPNLGQAMKTLSLSEAKMKLSALIDSINVTDEEVMITRNGAPAAVLVSPNEFESWRETIAVKSDADLMAEIKTGLRKLKGKKAALYTLEELIGE
jgi:prevent-host-death family protein|tara:strand:- start:473 stop:775 length:303 start_codon:yes stop_codon:yes gene_type:complete